MSALHTRSATGLNRPRDDRAMAARYPQQLCWRALSGRCDRCAAPRPTRSGSCARLCVVMPAVAVRTAAKRASVPPRQWLADAAGGRAARRRRRSRRPCDRVMRPMCTVCIRVQYVRMHAPGGDPVVPEHFGYTSGTLRKPERLLYRIVLAPFRTGAASEHFCSACTSEHPGSTSKHFGFYPRLTAVCLLAATPD